MSINFVFAFSGFSLFRMLKSFRTLVHSNCLAFRLYIHVYIYIHIHYLKYRLKEAQVIFKSQYYKLILTIIIIMINNINALAEGGN